MTTTDAPEPNVKRRTPLWVLLLAVAVPVAAVVGGLYLMWVTRPVQENKALNEELTIRTVGLANPPVQNALDARFADANGDAVADPPPADQAVNPDVLGFSYIATDDPEQLAAYRANFKEFMDHLARATGKRVEYVPASSPDEQLWALREGRLHVTGLSTGAVPIAVNLCGFVPVGKLAEPDGPGTYEMQVLVPAGSPIRTPADLKGHELAVTDATSNSGFKAPLVMLRDEFDLLPERDYTIRYSGSHDASIRGIAARQYEAAAVANDVLRRAEAAGVIQAGQYTVIHQSHAFPTAAVGYVHNLDPSLAGKLREAIMSFPWAGTGMERQFGPSGQTRFAPVDYRQDWELVRQIDDKMGVKHELRKPATAPATTAPSEEPGTAPAAPEAAAQ